MPIYEFACDPCDYKLEMIRRMGDYTPPSCYRCKEPMYWIVSVPTMHTWDQERKFPNVTKTGDGTMQFETRSTYECYMKEQGIAESSTDAPVKTPHGAAVKKYG